MKQMIYVLAVAATVGFAQNATAATYATAFKKAEATFQNSPEPSIKYDRVWDTATSSTSCGTNCRQYYVEMYVTFDEQWGSWSLARMDASMYKNGTTGSDLYYYADWDVKTIEYGNGYYPTVWIDPIESAWRSGNGYIYRARHTRPIGTYTTPPSHHSPQMKFKYLYTSTFPWCYREVVFGTESEWDYFLT